MAGKFYEDISIAASAKTTYEFQSRTDGSQNFFPYTRISIFNTGTTNLKVYLNDREDAVFVPAGTILELDQKVLKMLLYKVVFENASSSTAGKYSMKVENESY